MAGKVLDIQDIIVPDQLGTRIAQHWVEWQTARAPRVEQWKEVRKYVYATDTRQTSNNSLPWKNSTTIPKMCQIRDNLYANYMAALFPKRKWLTWESDSERDATKEKRDAIENYMMHTIERGDFRSVIAKCVYDYIDYGMPFATVDWVDNRTEGPNGEQIGFVGPVARRINPMDVLMNPIAPSVQEAPKIIRTWLTLGELKSYMESLTPSDKQEEIEETYNYLLKVRQHVGSSDAELTTRDEYFQMDGFDSFRRYLMGDYVEVLTFYGDMYDYESNTFYRNHMITVVDRHKIVGLRPNPTFFDHAPIYSTGWRKRQDNLWAMGPLDNLVGLQYRLDHVENLKADVFDLIAFPPLKIRGYVDEFEWAPMSRIHMDGDGDVDMLVPDTNALNANLEIANLENKMEEMAGAPKQAMGFRTPGEKTAFEVQRLENAAGRIFQNKIAQFEEEFVEPLLNAMLEMAARKLDGNTIIRIFDDDNKIEVFRTLSASDITGQGRVRPVAARHFAERAERIQNITNFMGSALGTDPEIRRHFSSIRLARMVEDLLDLDSYEVVAENVRILEQQEAEQLSNVTQQQSMEHAMTPSGLTPDDADTEF